MFSDGIDDMEQHTSAENLYYQQEDHYTVGKIGHTAQIVEQPPCSAIEEMIPYARNRTVLQEQC